MRKSFHLVGHGLDVQTTSLTAVHDASVTMASHNGAECHATRAGTGDADLFQQGEQQQGRRGASAREYDALEDQCNGSWFVARRRHHHHDGEPELIVTGRERPARWTSVRILPLTQ